MSKTQAPEGAHGDERDVQEQPFEDWWEREGQFGRAGGGQYEKTFAWNAWCAASKAQPKGTVSEFTNELGNSIRITIEGPTSTSENVLTPMEAAKLRGALNEHATQAPAPVAGLPAGWRLATVSDGDIRVYGPDKETWLIRKDSGEGFYDFIHRFFEALASQAPAAGADNIAAMRQALDAAARLKSLAMLGGSVLFTAEFDALLRSIDALKAALGESNVPVQGTQP